MIAYWPILTLGVVLLLAVMGHTEHMPPSLPPLQERRIGIFPAVENIVSKDGVSALHISRDDLHVVAVAHTGKHLVVYSDGKPDPIYDAIGGVSLSPTGGHIAYAAKKGDQWFLVYDGIKDKPCDGINEAWDYQPIYPPTNPYEGAFFGQISPDAALQFSDDGKHFAYARQDGTKHCVVMDGHAGPEYDAVGELQLSADGRHLDYLAKQGQVQFAIIDGHPGPSYSGIGQLVLSHEGRHTAYVAYQANKYFVVADGRAGPTFSFIGYGALTFSPDSKRTAYSAWIDRGLEYGIKHVAVVDGQVSTDYEEVTAPVFSPDSKQVAYIASIAPTVETVVLNGRPGPKYSSISDVQFSADSCHLAYTACDQRKYFEIFDGKPGSKYDLIAQRGTTTSPILSPDGRRVAYEARIGIPGHDWHGFPIAHDTVRAHPFIVVDSKPGPKYGGLYQLLFSPDSRHIAYMAEKGNHWLVVLDGQEGNQYNHIRELKFSADSKHLVYAADKDIGKYLDDRMVVVIDGREGPEYQMILDDPPIFTSADAVTYFAVGHGVLYHVVQHLAK
jgi:WD40 repeat protein